MITHEAKVSLRSYIMDGGNIKDYNSNQHAALLKVHSGPE
jgi:hypothetical protein